MSSFNAPGNVLSVSLPAPGAVRCRLVDGLCQRQRQGHHGDAERRARSWRAARSLPSLTLGPGNYEYAELVSDGSQYRLTSATRNTRTANGVESRDWPGNWLYPASPGYAATLADNGTVLSSFNTADGLTVTLPSTDRPAFRLVDRLHDR